ncbi:hypothetical protein JTB14_023400 [Gonioctena quinquepunctata]|nr:hypothetical protein JTB14_023400 [Gonioctena quinquepunctata]
MDELDYLSFTLQNMTKAELIENLYLSDDDGNIDVESIPSDNESSVGEDMNDDNSDNVPVPDIFSDSDSDTEEDIIPLDLQARLLSKKHVSQQRESLSDQPVWTKDNSPFENTTFFTSASGVADFIKNQTDLMSPGMCQRRVDDQKTFLPQFKLKNINHSWLQIKGFLRQNTSQHIAPEEDVHCAAQVKTNTNQLDVFNMFSTALYGKR